MAEPREKKRFSSVELERIGRVTRDITAKGSYEVNGTEVELPAAPAQIQKAAVVDQASCTSGHAQRANRKAKYSVVNCGSYEAVLQCGLDPGVTLVHNFANAHHPGGGFLWGASAQEECLCRESTLYASLISDDAAPYYESAAYDRHGVTNCNMIYSPTVIVFRNGDYSFRTEPYIVSVATLAGPNRSGTETLGASQQQIDEALRQRLALLLDYAAEQGKTDLVLGAWGCGAFGNDPLTVANITRELLIDEGRENNFDNIVFAVLDAAKERNYPVFERVFADRLSAQ